MPELPEVETVRRGVEARLIGLVVAEARLFRRDVLVAPGDPSGGFSRQRAGRRARPTRVEDADLLAGATITSVLRRGKQIAIIGRDAHGIERALGVQLGMTGHLGFEDWHAGHIHAEWIVQAPGGPARMVFSDPRRFGGLRVFRTLDELDKHWNALGPDALSIRAADLHAGLQGSKRAIKAALLDQVVLAGVGNIYADEALFRARIHPQTFAGRLDAAASARLAEAIRTVLAAACASGGSTLRNFASADGTPGSYQDHHSVYGRAGLPCPSCNLPLRSAVIGQRTTVWCAACQAQSKRTPRRPNR